MTSLPPTDAELRTLFTAAVDALEGDVRPTESSVALIAFRHALDLLSRQERPIHLDNLVRHATRLVETPPPRRGPDGRPR